jgi:hypothetical protein
VTNPKKAQQQVEALTRSTIGVTGCPVTGIPDPRLAAE